jgi:hypothetical protein
MRKRQAVVALSTTEAEYMATTHASKEAVWLQRLHSGIGLVQQAVRLDCDSQSAIFLEKKPTYHLKTKHIDVQYHFVRDMVEEKKVLLEKVDTLKNVADSLTKSVSIEKFSWCRVDPGGYWWPPTYSTWMHTIVSFSFSVSLIVAQFTIFSSSSGLELPELF